MAFPKYNEIDQVLLQVLADLGGHARPQETYPRVAEFFPQLTPADLETRLPSNPHIRRWWNMVQWAKQRLQENKCIEGTPSSFEGEWQITQHGIEVLKKNPPSRQPNAHQILETAESPSLFSSTTFELLERLHAEPTQAFYTAHKHDFKQHLEIPFNNLLKLVAARLPSDMTNVLETKSRILARIPKNDYGAGGAWDFYWGAFYPKGGKRTEDAQLFIWINHQRIECGFFIGNNGKAQRERFAANLSAITTDYATSLKQCLHSLGVVYGSRDDGIEQAETGPAVGQTNDWSEWVANFNSYGPGARIKISREQGTSCPGDPLAEEIADLFENLFPLFLMATEANPFDKLESGKPLAATAPGITNEKPSPQKVIVHYDKAKAMEDLFLAGTQFDEMLDALKEKKNVVLQGAPGVGKTFVARRLAYALIESNDQRQFEIIQFHQSYSYEDFIQGFRPAQNGNFDLKFGRFYQFCRRAQLEEATKKPYVFIIDEINRGNLSKIFGELMMLIEPDKRGAEHAIPLAYSQDHDEKFYLPENLYLIGMMNTADRSLAMVDYALRRRFRFITLRPEFNSNAFSKCLAAAGAAPEMIEKIASRMNALNEIIIADVKNLGPGYQIGHSYFCPRKGIKPDDNWYTRVIESEIVPLIQEYWFDNEQKVNEQRSALLA